MNARGEVITAAALAATMTLAPAVSQAKPPPPLSADTTPVDIDSTYGSGHFGRWDVDQWGLPAYNYTDDELTDPDARQPELDGSTAAQHQLGNDNIKGMAFNDGYVQLWSQDLLAQWANLYQPSDRHYAGGYGYINVEGKVGSTLYADHPTGEDFGRTFGVGYYRKLILFQGVRVTEDTFAPFGNDPVLLDDVTLTNTTHTTKTASWFEYWDVNPYNQSLGTSGTVGLPQPHPPVDLLRRALEHVGDVGHLGQLVLRERHADHTGRGRSQPPVRDDRPPERAPALGRHAVRVQAVGHARARPVDHAPLRLRDGAPGSDRGAGREVPALAEGAQHLRASMEELPARGELRPHPPLGLA
jgi:hypothetical protein